ncbi:MAG TPA: hypothetical protein PLO33_13985 [Kouleothrix sp.]|uniref:hypothetical protein n=1 Tax=Kouleothrix sp. TaxID=2779161 RepID=UPI002BFE6CF8|nr:hypothetical protein [Kouleothrix sp.]HRC76782.1 hypothetical protein [Kouleothrix sp.]
MSDPATRSIIQLIGALAFGIIIGWRVYFTDRYRTAAVDFGDLATVIGIIGGGAILALFQAGTDLFGAYGVGLAIGFFGYHIRLARLVRRSANFDDDFFIDGRRKKIADDEFIPDYVRPTTTAMGDITKPRPPAGGADPNVPVIH